MQIEALDKSLSDVYGPEPRVLHFEIDINIDGVKTFESPAAESAMPILAKVFSVRPNPFSSRDVIKLKNLEPFIVGFYHGKHKTH